MAHDEFEGIEEIDGAQREEWSTRRIEIEERKTVLYEARGNADRALGRFVYEAHGDDASYRAGCEEAFEAVDEIQAELIVCDAELAKLDEEIRAAIASKREEIRREQNDEKANSVAATVCDGDPKNEACPRCGASLNPDALFCMMCGSSIEEMRSEEPEPEAVAMRFCPGCGSEVGPEDLFCMSCGTKLQ